MSDIFREPLPTDGIMQQFALGAHEYSDNTMIPLIFNLNFKKTPLIGFNKTLHIYYDIPPISHLDLTVQKNCIMDITLSDDNWRWSTQYQAITTKVCHADTYKGLLYIDQSGSGHPWKYEMSGSYKTVRFYAHKKDPPPHGHGFCLNVEFKVPRSNLWLPVVIDPDIINPRPSAMLLEYFKIGKNKDGTIRLPLFSLNEEFDFIPT
jgi:hypothetical protein